MAHLVPSIDFIRKLTSEIEGGSSVQMALVHLTEFAEEPFVEKMGLWFAYQKHSMGQEVIFKTQYQRNLVEILEQGLRGAPVCEHLVVLEREMSEEFDRQWKAYLESLPMKLSIPLLLFFFPSYVILLFGPLIMQFLMEVR